MAKPAEVAKRAREITAKKTALLRAAVEKRRSQTKEITMKQDDVVEAAYEKFLNRLEPGLAGCDMKFIFLAGYQAALSAQPIQQDDVVEAANTSRCTLASEALFMARHRLSKEGFGPDDPTIKAINDGIAALSAQHSDLAEIKTWEQRCEEQHLDHEIVTDGMIQSRMKEEIADLRGALRSNRAAIVEECARVAECEAMWGTDKQGLRERIAKHIRSLNGGDHV